MKDTGTGPANSGADGLNNKGRAAGPDIVTHFIAGYPSYQASLDVARALVAGGAFALEMQIPFSDPSADGPVIEEACRVALDNGFRVEDAWKLLRTIRFESDIPVFVMSYASLVFTPGVSNFVRAAREAGASGFIVPDLVPRSDEGLFAAAADAGVPAVPVIVPWIDDKRLDEILAEPIEWVYVALRSGITGTYTELGEEQEAFLKKLKRKCDGLRPRDKRPPTGEDNRMPGKSRPRVMAGFGIQDAEQVKAVTALADAAIVGSALVKAIGRAGSAGSGGAARALLEMLRGV
jgi:tryptophan synthase alpha chain